MPSQHGCARITRQQLYNQSTVPILPPPSRSPATSKDASHCLLVLCKRRLISSLFLQQRKAHVEHASLCRDRLNEIGGSRFASCGNEGQGGPCQDWDVSARHAKSNPARVHSAQQSRKTKGAAATVTAPQGRRRLEKSCGSVTLDQRKVGLVLVSAACKSSGSSARGVGTTMTPS